MCAAAKQALGDHRPSLCRCGVQETVAAAASRGEDGHRAAERLLQGLKCTGCVLFWQLPRPASLVYPAPPAKPYPPAAVAGCRGTQALRACHDGVVQGQGSCGPGALGLRVQMAVQGASAAHWAGVAAGVAAAAALLAACEGGAVDLRSWWQPKSLYLIVPMCCE